MKKLLNWIPTTLFLLVFGFWIVLFHGLQVIALKLFGYHAHKRTVDVLMWCLNKSLVLMGYRVKMKNQAGQLPKDRPIIIVSNHQGMMDIPAIGVALRKYHPKFIAKDALGKGIPSISYNLRHGGSIMINRRNGRDAIVKIAKFSKYLQANNYAGVIFPEGTRSKDGKMLDFKPVGLLKLLKDMPEAIVVPVALQNYWQIERYKLKPIPFGKKLTCTIMPPVDRSAYENEKALIAALESQIKAVAESDL